jgi:cephalosporin hydroxylase
MKEILEKILIRDLGVSGYHVYDAIKEYKNSTIVELGTWVGESTQLFLLDSEEKNNVLHCVDVTFIHLPNEIKNNHRVNLHLGDSPTIGKYWDVPVDILFVDTFHIKEQVLSELYYWYKHVNEGGLIIFHDTNWPEHKHDEYGGILWERPEEAIKDFFDIPNLNFENDYIKSVNYPEKWGVTIIEIKKKTDYVSRYEKWYDVFNKRNHLISLFWNEENKSDVKIDLVLNV